MGEGVTIGQAAHFVGVTIKTIRHYHRRGAVPEPERDFSGYRRYTSSDLLRLVQARTLAEAGVAIGEIGELMAGGDEVAAAIDRVEHELTEKIALLSRRRERLRRLRHGDRALLPPLAAGLLDRMDQLGFEPECVQAHQESFVLAYALAPQQFEAFAEQMQSRLADPEAAELMKRSWLAASWQPDDPRLRDLAAAVADNLLSHPGHLALPQNLDALPEARSRVEIINHHRGDELPTTVVLTMLIEECLRARGFAMPSG